MPKMKVSVPHQLGTEEAMRRIQNLLSDLKRDHGDQVSDLKENWTEHGGTFSFKAMGFSLKGSMDVTPTAVTVEGDLPFAAMPFRGKLETMFRERAAELLA
jgi:hypothetical protein